MYYLLLVVGVVCLLALAAWLLLAQRQRLAIAVPLAAGGVQAVDTPRDAIARLLKGTRNEDKPCLTPIDCVQANRCAGHCGCR